MITYSGGSSTSLLRSALISSARSIRSNVSSREMPWPSSAVTSSPTVLGNSKVSGSGSTMTGPSRVVCLRRQALASSICRMPAEA